MRTNGHGIPIVALDIDGTIADYHTHFLTFAAQWIGKPMPHPMEINPGKRLSEWMGVEHSVYQECKLAFRQGGLKRFMPVYEGADRLTHGVKALGAEVWICTTRPYLRLDNIDPDTREWLRRYNIHYDAVLFGDDKYAELARQAGDRVIVVFDDLPEQCIAAIGEGFPTYVRDQPYNRHFRVEEFEDLRVHSCPEMLHVVQRRVIEWKGSNEH